MKKGGIHEVNSFISIAPSERTRDLIIRKPSKNAASSISSSSVPLRPTKVVPSSTKHAADPVKNTKLISKKDAADNFNIRKTGKNLNQLSTATPSTNVDKIQIKTKENKSFPPKMSTVLKPSRPTKTLSSNETTNRIPRSSIAEEKRAVSSRKITMDDVYKSRLSLSKTGKASTPSSSTSNVTPSSDKTILAKPNTDTNHNQVMFENKDDTGIIITKEVDDDDYNYEYEDDFEDYESTFESYSGSGSNDSLNLEEITTVDHSENRRTIVEEEKKMDSGSYDLMYRKQMLKERNQLDIIKEALQKENAGLQYEISKKSFQLPLSIIKNDLTADLLINYNVKSMENFSNAGIRQRKSMTARMMKIRGEKLLKMISLDVMSYVLHDQPSVPYEVFMRSFARQNTKQVYTQTHEDNLSCEVQTEEITIKTKWSQYPVRIPNNQINENINLTQLLAGVGDENADPENYVALTEIKTQKLNNFVTTFGEEMIAVLEENLHQSELDNVDNSERNATKISSYISRIKYREVNLLKEHPVVSLYYDPHDAFRLLAVHAIQNKVKGDRNCLLSVWNIYQPWSPKFILKSHGNVSCACFVAGDSLYVVAGHNDGSLCVWNLTENNMYSMEFRKHVEAAQPFKIKLPSYNTAYGVLKHPNYHKSTIVQVDTTDDKVEKDTTERRAGTVFSIEKENILIIWTLSMYSSGAFDIGSAPWSKVKFFVTQTINLADMLPKDIFQITVAKVLSECHILFGTNAGFAVKCSLYGKKLKKYGGFHLLSSSNEKKNRITNLEICPYDRVHFLVAFATGNIRLFHIDYTEPVSEIFSDIFPLVLNPIVVQWLWSDKDHIILVSDFHVKSRLRIHQFRAENSLPIFEEELEHKIELIVVSPFLPNERALNFALVTEFEIQVHKLTPLNNLKKSEK